MGRVGTMNGFIDVKNVGSKFHSVQLENGSKIDDW